MLHYENLQLYLRLEFKLKKLHRVLSQWLKTYVEFNAQRKRIEAERNGEKYRKALHKIMNNAAYGKVMENVRNRIDAQFVSNEKEYLKWTSKPSYMSHKIFHIDLATVRKKVHY